MSSWTPPQSSCLSEIMYQWELGEFPPNNRDYTTMSAELMRFIQPKIDFYIDQFLGGRREDYF